MPISLIINIKWKIRNKKKRKGKKCIILDNLNTLCENENHFE